MTAPTSPPVAGDQPEPLVDRALTVTDFVRYQGASADFNPIHHDQAFAAKAGFDKPFAVGMFAAGVMANYAADWLGPNNIRHYRVRFSEQAWPGDVLTYTGTVIEVRHGDTSDEVDVELQATTQTGSVHIRGWATFCLPAHVA